MKHLSFILCICIGMISSPLFPSNKASIEEAKIIKSSVEIQASKFHRHETDWSNKPKRADSPRKDPRNITWFKFFINQKNSSL